MVETFEGIEPEDRGSLFIAWNAHVSGDVVLGKESSVWYSVTMRGDVGPIRIGDRTNIQDNSVCHVSTDNPLEIGNGVTVGHGVILHSCKIDDNCLIGMGATVLDDVEIGRNSIVGAGSLVTKGKKFPPRSLILGNPAKLVKELTDEQVESIKAYADRYIENSKRTARNTKVSS